MLQFEILLHGLASLPLGWRWIGTDPRARDQSLRDRLAARWAVRPPPELPEERLLTLAVIDGLGALRQELRQVLVLRFYADLTIPRIADLLEVPEGTVKSRLHTAVGALRAQLAKDEVI